MPFDDSVSAAGGAVLSRELLREAQPAAPRESASRHQRWPDPAGRVARAGCLRRTARRGAPSATDTIRTGEAVVSERFRLDGWSQNVAVRRIASLAIRAATAHRRLARHRQAARRLALNRAEIGKRLTGADLRSDSSQRNRPEAALAVATASITALIEALPGQR